MKPDGWEQKCSTTSRQGQQQLQQQTQTQQNTWSLSWQLKASGNFLLGEIKGVGDTTVAPVLQAVEHPVATAEGVADAVAHPIQTVENAAKGLVDTAKGVASGDPRAIGQVAGAVISAAVGAKVAQEAKGLKVVANRVRAGDRADEIQHIGFVNSKIHVGREGTDWHIGLGRAAEHRALKRKSTFLFRRPVKNLIRRDII